MGNSVDDRKRFIESTNVSRETLEKLDQYAKLLKKWNKAINLVAPSTLPQVWTRHLLDSAQIHEYAPNDAKIWLDIGSGAGFPGLVVSCFKPEIQVICLESDQRKSVFLQTVIRELGLNATVIAERIENVPPIGADIVSARALAPLKTLLVHSKRHLRDGGISIFLKGSGYLEEIKDAKTNWAFDLSTRPSKTDNNAAVLILGDLKRE